jgi:hypothetical protein
MFWKSILYPAFQCLIYKGSGVPTEQYIPLINCISQLNPNLSDVRIEPYSLWKRNEFKEDTFIVGHSFGGYFALKDALHDPNDKIKGIVLLNSHFNSRRKAIYPGIYQKKVHIPVLTLLGDQDERLPLEWGLDDFWESLENKPTITQKYYRVYSEHGHFTGLQTLKSLDTVKIACDITRFLKGNITTVNQYDRETMEKYGFHPVKNLSRQGWNDLHQALNIIDFLYSMFLPTCFWSWLHFIHFLASSPKTRYFPFFEYNKDILLKSSHYPYEDMIRDYKSLFSAKNQNRMDSQIEKITLPANIVGLYLWLLFPLFSIPFTKIQIYEWPLPNNITYYKLPSPSKLLTHLLK